MTDCTVILPIIRYLASTQQSFPTSHCINYLFLAGFNQCWDSVTADPTVFDSRFWHSAGGSSSADCFCLWFDSTIGIGRRQKICLRWNTATLCTRLSCSKLDINCSVTIVYITKYLKPSLHMRKNCLSSKGGPLPPTR